jgi:poly-gamma-glutamate synthesis protein (capsule biosynthesis protein)
MRPAGTIVAETSGDGRPSPAQGSVRLFLCGDVMTGRGIDQVLEHPSPPRLFEPYVKSATDYVELAEEAGGRIARPVPPQYIWGEALAELERREPDARIVNLETAVTISDDAWPDKGIHYRMHPRNTPCLTAAGIHCCVLANNHVLDWGYRGLAETLGTLRRAAILTAGAGDDETEAAAPAIVELAGERRLLVFAYGSPTSGVEATWAARRRRAGVNLLDERAPGAVSTIAHNVARFKRPGDLVILSVHWGSNWGYEVTRAQVQLARRLIDEAGVDLVHGHSSHHPRPIEVHNGKLILYGCGDFLNDYEGIAGHDAFRPDLCLMFFPDLDAASGRLLRLILVPMRIHEFRLNRPSSDDTGWLQQMLDRENRAFGSHVERAADGSLRLAWSSRSAA